MKDYDVLVTVSIDYDLKKYEWNAVIQPMTFWGAIRRIFQPARVCVVIVSKEENK